MRPGHEYLHEINTAINNFEDAVVHRENKKMLESKVSLQQDADRARENLVLVLLNLSEFVTIR